MYRLKVTSTENNSFGNGLMYLSLHIDYCELHIADTLIHWVGLESN